MIETQAKNSCAKNKKSPHLSEFRQRNCQHLHIWKHLCKHLDIWKHQEPWHHLAFLKFYTPYPDILVSCRHSQVVWRIYLNLSPCLQRSVSFLIQIPKESSWNSEKPMSLPFYLILSMKINILLYLELNPLTILILNSQTSFDVFSYLKQLQAFPSSFLFNVWWNLKPIKTLPMCTPCGSYQVSWVSQLCSLLPLDYVTAIHYELLDKML